MNGYIIFTWVSLAICLIAYAYHLIKIISLGKPKDFSEPIGNVGAAIVYSFTGGMSPQKKESAYLHLPTYAAGIIYHLGTFLSILLFFLFIFEIHVHPQISIVLSSLLIIAGLCGLGILFKRILKKGLRQLSNPDDYISNLLVTTFQIITAISLLYLTPVYFIFVSLLLLYLPVGKLKHSIFFFAARYHLGFFYGRRGVWPPKLK
jgi:nitrate reductase gamma subunit